MPAPWTIDWSTSAQRDLKKLDPPTTQRIFDDVAYYARTDLGDVKKLQGPGHRFRLRIGEWRVIFTRDLATNTLRVQQVSHRREAYR